MVSRICGKKTQYSRALFIGSLLNRTQREPQAICRTAPP
jgi:hypothetical protein